ncbi:MAG: hypothetical protein J7J73_00220 [Deltaproteobacteria bacterium]|nr:hypothetical protein [Deltaproteobacteria bacterium]
MSGKDNEAWKIAQWMNKNDQIAVNLGMKVVKAKLGKCAIEMKVADNGVEIKREDGVLVGLFTGTVFRRDDHIEQWMKS